MSEFLCKCGHKKDNHHFADKLFVAAPHVGVCGACHPTLDNLHEFKPDTLRYLEQLYETKSLNNLYK